MKWRAIQSLGIITLFIGIAVSNSIAVEQEEEFVEINIELCGLNGVQKNTFQFTNQEYATLNEKINQMKLDLDYADSIEERNLIYIDMIDYLYENNYLSEKLNLDLFKQLVTGQYLKNPYFKSIINNYLFEHSNCHIDGESNNTYIVGAMGVLSYILSEFSIFGIILFSLLHAFTPPIVFFSWVSYGYVFYNEGSWGGRKYPADGYIRTVKLIGSDQHSQQHGGKFWGDFFTYTTEGFIWAFYSHHVGTKGFFGIKINEFYFGSALNVRITDEI